MLKYWHDKFPGIELEIEYFWPGLIGASKDFLPVLGADADRPKVLFAGGAAGLPWAASLGKYLADKITNNRCDFDQEFAVERLSPLGGKIDKLLPKPLAFAAAQGIVKLL
jgi:gamma-glutamylputrescine oxidase